MCYALGFMNGEAKMFTGTLSAELFKCAEL